MRQTHHWWTQRQVLHLWRATGLPARARTRGMSQRGDRGHGSKNGTSRVSWVNNHNLDPTAPPKASPRPARQTDSWTAARHRSLQPQLALATLSYLILRAVYPINNRGSGGYKMPQGPRNACCSAKKPGESIRFRTFSSYFNSGLRNFVGGSEDLRALPNSEGTKYN